MAMLLSLLAALPRRGDRGLERLPVYIHKAETYIRANLTEKIDLDTLVGVSGVSRRTLQVGFRRYRQTTPMRLVKSLRLAAARADLSARPTDKRSVTRVATEYNFYQLSKFSRDFRSAFGDLPSRLAQRSVD